MSSSSGEGKWVCYDGNRAAVHVAYAMSEIAFIYPITPSSPMAEVADMLSADGRKNCMGHEVSVYQMQSEGGAAGAIHGGAAAGSLVTSFTASQGLLLMVPDLFKLAGELLPAVLHVAARQVSQSSSSIFGEHSDVMATRHTGIAILSSATVQDCMDYAAVAHVASLNASLPVLHFFDGFHISHELAKVREIPYSTLAALVPWDAVQRHRDRASHPAHPSVYGTLQGRDSYFQGYEASQPTYDAAPAVFERAMAAVSAATGRKLSLFEYVGAPDADRVVVMMGAGSGAAIEAAQFLNATTGSKLGVLRVHLYRPWSAAHFLAALPASVRALAVLDRTKDPGASGDPLYLDVVATIARSPLAATVAVVAGRYGIGDKRFTPEMAAAVFDNLAKPKPMHAFTVGIDDDVRHMSLPVGAPLTTVPAGTRECVFWGFGSDGTVGANRLAVELIALNTELYAQGVFFFTAHKAGGVTTSHLRFGPSPITSTYPISRADYVAVHHPGYLAKFPVADVLKEGGTFVVNSTWDAAEFSAKAPAALRKKLASLHAKVYTVDAYKVAKDAGLAGHTNVIMQAVFFAVSGVMPVDRSVALLKDSVFKAYGKKGEEIVRRNVDAIDNSLTGLREIKYAESEWLAAQVPPVVLPDTYTPWVRKLKLTLDRMEGDKLPVSVFVPGGQTPTDTTWQEKRCIATQVPTWNSASCVQCNTCSILCPHAAIRPFLFDADEAAKAPKGMAVVPAKAMPPQLKDKNFGFRIQVSTLDCTGCAVCVAACPSKGTLTMVPLAEELKATEVANWDYCRNAVLNRSDLFEMPSNTKLSQFRQPLFEFSAACSGCGESGYIKLLTQLFGERMVVSNAAGCSAAIAVTYGSCPYATTPAGWGPALRCSLFEENAEFAFGMMRAQRGLRAQLHETVTALLADEAGRNAAGAQLCELLGNWMSVFEDSERALRVSQKVMPLVGALDKAEHPLLKKIHALRDAFVKVTYWTMGGDGWAYDIDYGGLDHVLSMGAETRVIVLDTEVYSNTGGQMSKATPEGGIHKFAAKGKERAKKDLGMISMSYGHIYVAQVCLDANPQQALKAFLEADTYPGPALVLCYAPCIEHGIEGGSEQFVAHAKLAVSSGYWPLYRFNPLNVAKGKPALEIDGPSQSATTPESMTKSIQEFLIKENRFARLAREKPERAAQLHKNLVDRVVSRWANLKRKVQDGAPAPEKK